MPYKNIDSSLWDKMDSCVEQVQATGKDKQAAIAICYTSVVEGEKLAEAIFKYDQGLLKSETVKEAAAKKVGGKSYPADDFLVVDVPEVPATWHLQVSKNGKPDHRLMGAAWAALHGGYRGNKYEGPNKQKAIDMLKKIYKDQEMPTPAEESAKPAISECDYPEMVPYGAKSFADLEAMEQAKESAEKVREYAGQFQTLVGNILADETEANKTQAISNLTSEFIGLVSSVTGEIALESAEVGKRVNGKMKERLVEIKKQLDELMSWADYDDQDDPSSPLEKPSAHKESAVEIDLSAIAENIELTESASGAAIELAEDDLAPAATDRRSPLKINIRLIKPGFGNKADNNYYSQDVLKRDAHLFEGVKMYPTDHIQGQKSAMNEVSVIEKIVRFDEDGSPIARVNIFDPEFAEKTRNRIDAGQIGTLECSILAKGTARPGVINGRKGNVVEAITEPHSVDWVTRAGAGGQALNLAESEKQMNQKPEQDIVIVETGQAATPQAEPVKPVEISEGAPVAPPAPDNSGTPAAPVSLAEAVVEQLLSASHLPNELKEIMRERQYKDEAEFGERHAVMIERAKKLTGSGQPFGLGAPRTETKKATPSDLAEIQRQVNSKFLGGHK